MRASRKVWQFALVVSTTFPNPAIAQASSGGGSTLWIVLFFFAFIALLVWAGSREQPPDQERVRAAQNSRGAIDDEDGVLNLDGESEGLHPLEYAVEEPQPVPHQDDSHNLAEFENDTAIMANPETPDERASLWWQLLPVVMIGVGLTIGNAAANSPLGPKLFVGGLVGSACGAIPYFIGRNRSPKLARIAFWISAGVGAAFGLLGAVPTALAFVGYFLFLATEAGDEAALSNMDAGTNPQPPSAALPANGAAGGNARSDVSVRHERAPASMDVPPHVVPSPAPTAPPTSTNPLSTLRDLAQLRDEGILTPEEFDVKKREVLARI